MPGHDNIDFAGMTDVGVRRSHNQDAYSTLPATDKEQWRGRGHVFLIADGMGAHAVGELASKLAADSIPHIYSKYAKDGPIKALRRAFSETNAVIHNRGQQNREFEGMGTTSTALLIRQEGVWVGHVGDSRAYRIRDNKVEQLSFDHSLVWEMARRQRVSPDDLKDIPTNVIIRSLGPEADVQVDVEGPHPVRPGDIFVLCSDGLSGPVTDRDIGAIATALPPQEACRFLIDMANLHGGPDNISCIVVHVDEQLGHEGSSSWMGALVPKGAKWYQKLPWPLLTLVLGVVLAVVAILLAQNDLPGRLPAFLLAAFALMAGVAGLFVQYRQDSTEQADASDEDVAKPKPVRVYRQVPCTIDERLVAKIAKDFASLEARLRETGVAPDWDASHRLRDKADQLHKKKQLKESYREYCRAMRVLTEALQKQRNKEEMFQPSWDKKPAH